MGFFTRWVGRRQRVRSASWEGSADDSVVSPSEAQRRAPIGRPGRRDDLVLARVREALSLGGCPVCRLAHHAVHRFLDTFLYERVNDPGTREELRAAWGFCPQHAWMLPAQRHPVLGVAITYLDLLRRLRSRLDTFLCRRRGGLARALWSSLRPSASCPACRHLRRMEEVYAASVADHASDPELRRALSGPAALCLPHLLLASSLARSEEAVRDLAASYRQAVLQLEADLSELVRRHDYRFRHEGLTPEQATSWLRALQAFHGRDPDEGRVEFRVRPGPLGSSLELG